MKFIEELNLDNKKVILRLDLNVTIKNNEILDDTKLKKSIPTIKYLLNRGCHVLMMSHLGKIKVEDDKVHNSLKIVCDRLSELLEMPISFIKETRGSSLEESFNNNRLTMMENTRYEDYPGKKESSCDEELSKYWASLGEVFINDAFGTSHRSHASNAGISKYLESGYGFLIYEEVQGLDPVINNIKQPFVVVMGGAKVDDKIALIETLIKECDYLLVGGGIANTFLRASDKRIGSSLYSAEFVDKIKELINLYPKKIYMPVDVVVQNENRVETYNIDDVPLNSTIYDIGPQTSKLYNDILQNAKTIFVNGTMGMYEDENYRNGTESLYRSVANTDAIKIAGGGDAVASVNKLGYKDAFDFLSTGGGATLDYIAYKKLKCFEK